uniref:Uncharacterized protein n=1 Tax=Magallana gigas TaxID=29159 RepID=K1R1N7_MAGGI
MHDKAQSVGEDDPLDSCTFPSVLEGKTWEDSDKGQPVTFSGSDMLGWNVSAFSTVMNQWECLFNQNDIIVSNIETARLKSTHPVYQLVDIYIG